MIKMDVFMLLGAVLLAYGGMLFIYYNIQKKEKKNKLSDLMFAGMTSMRRGNLDKALIYFHKVYEHSIEVDDKEHMGESLYNIGIILERQGRTDEALRFFEEALVVYNEIGDQEGRRRARQATKSLQDR